MSAAVDGDVLVDRLFALLAAVSQAAGADFSGIGVIISDAPDRLPIMSLRSAQPMLLPTTNAAALLATISKPQNEYHDGFHVLSGELEPLLIAQYFSPPIVPNLAIDRSRRFGGRYVAALFGSVLPGVCATGIASNDFGNAVFAQGHEVRFAALR